jgi:diacylglycerol kinase family enzyme
MLSLPAGAGEEVVMTVISQSVRRIAVVYNPSSGRVSKAISPSDIKRLLPSGVALEWLVSPSAGTAHMDWGGSLAEEFDLVLAAGGDGTVMACAGLLLGQNIPLGILPCGTGNSLAASLGIPLALPHALDVALYGDRRPLDLGWANGKCFSLIAGLGVDAAIIARTNAQLKARIGRAAYLSGSRALLSLQRDTFEIQVDDGTPVLLQGYGVMVGNLSRFRAVQRKWPGATFHDGRFEVAVMRSHPALGSVWPADGRFVEWLTGRHVSIRSCRSHLLERDGDVDGSDDFLNVNVIPHGLTVCAPRMASAKQWRTVCGLFSAPR